MCGVNLSGRCLEGRHGALLLPSLRQGITSASSNLAEATCLLACLGERNERGAAEPDVAAFTFHDSAKNPTFGSARRDVQIQPVAVGEPPSAAGAGRRVLHRSHRQSMMWMSSAHSSAQLVSHKGSHIAYGIS
jgi:hypothetical protein